MTHSEYPALRRIFLQWLLVERIVLFEEATAFFNKCIADIDFGANEDNENDINVFIDYCKKSLTPIDLNLKKQLFVQADRKLEYIGIYNMKSDKFSQAATKLTAESMKQFKEIIDLAKTSPDHEFTMITAELSLKLSKNQVQALLNDLVDNQWLFFNKPRRVYSLGPRTLLELIDFIKEQDDENLECSFKDCSLCSSIISSGYTVCCKESQCQSYYHQFCINGYAESTGRSECPKCQAVI